MPKNIFSYTRVSDTERHFLGRVLEQKCEKPFCVHNEALTDALLMLKTCLSSIQTVRMSDQVYRELDDNEIFGGNAIIA